MKDDARNSRGATESVDGECETQSCETSDWKRAHRELSKLARTRANLDLEEGKWLVLALRSGVHVRLGYGSFAEYIERLFGYAPRFTYEKLRVAEALETLPVLTKSLSSGTASWSALRELTRVATPATEREWLDAARGSTVRDIEKLVSGHRSGSRPSELPDARARRHVLRFEVSGETLATFREAMAKIRRDSGHPVDDDAALLLLARHVLEGPKDEGRASYQVALTVCEECRRGRQHGRGELVEIAAEVVAMAECDAQRLGEICAGTRDFAETHVGRALADGRVGSRDDSATHVGSVGEPYLNVEKARAGRTRAKQEIPPAVRRAVLRRDGGRCTVPGCRNATFLDVHHIHSRADGGAHDPENLMTICSAHHRAIHRGEIVVEGSVLSGLRIRHADGTTYGVAVSPSVTDARAKAYRALRSMGFRENEVRRALERTQVGADASVELLVRECLLALTGHLARAS